MLRFAKRITLRAALALLAVTNLLEAPPARAQHLGDVSLTTTTQILANSVACTGNPQNFFPANLGQSFHLATAAILSGAASFVMEIDGVDAVNDAFKLSNPMITVGTTSFLVQGTGFMPIIRVSLTCTVGSTFSLSYSGSFAANTINAGAAGSGGVVSTIGGNVQGIVAQGVNGAPIFPVIGGGVRPPLNAAVLANGVDNFGLSTKTIPNGVGTATATLTPPIPTAPGEWGLAVLADTQAAVVNTLLGPWTCIGGAGACTTATTPAFAQLNLGTNNNLTFSYTNTTAQQQPASEFILFSNIPIVRQNIAGNQTTSTGSVTTGLNVLAGSTSVFAVTCSTLTCNLLPTDSQGNVVHQIGRTIQLPNGNGTLGMNVYVVGPTSAAADTLTFNAQAGTTVNGSGFLELTGLLSSNPTTLSTPLGVSNNVGLAQEDDPGGLFVEAGGFDFTQTLTLTGAATTLVPLWAQSQNGLTESCTVSLRVTAASGTTPTLNTFLQDSADGLGFNDRLSMPQATAAGSFLGAIPRFTAGSLAPTASSAVVGTDGVLAAGSGIAGNLAAFGRIKFVVGGTTPSFTFTYNVACR